ncbi:MAG TPA: hypothetical protein VIT44_04145 [Cyclobacteriaceae bacterium]
MKKPLFQKMIWLLPLLALCAWQPISFLDDLQSKFDQYISTNTSAKINLVFNQPYYAPGDTAFFSAWYTDDSFQNIKGTHIITMDLLSGQGKVHQRVKYKIQNGRAFNQIALRRDLPAGDFKLIAYTDWMKNSSSPEYFEKTMRVESRKEIISLLKEQDDIRTYPEGGHLIMGLSNKLAILGTSGKTVLIRDNENKELNKVTLDSTGMGTIVITPGTEGNYTAGYVTGKSFALPAAEKNGIAVTLDLNEPGRIQLSKSADLSNQLFAVVISEGKMIFKKEVEWSQDNTASIQIPSDNRLGGINHLYVLDEKGKTYAERIFSSTGKQSVSVIFDFPAQSGQREKVTGKISVQETSGSALESDFSLTVFQGQLFSSSQFAKHPFSNIPALYEREIKYGRQEESRINDFLITQSVKRINWNAVLNEKPSGKMMPLSDQIKLRGHVISKNGKPAPDSTDVIVYLQRNTIGYEDYTKDGKFEIPFIFEFSGDDQVFHSLHYKSKIMDSDYDVVIDQDSLKINTKWESFETSKGSTYGEYAFNKNLISRSYSFFTEAKNTSIQDQNLNRIFEDEFLGADFTVKISDFLVFPKIEDIFTEIVPFVHYRKKGEQETLRISYRTASSTRTYKEAPLLIIDGVMTRDVQSLLTLKPEKIVVVKVLNDPNKLTQVGKLGENGILFVETKNGSLAKTLSEENLFPITGLSKPVVSSIMDDKSKTVRTPDLRSTLYWNPSIKSSSSGNEISFHTGDDTGPMIIQVEGMTKDGRHFVAQHKIDVNFKSPNK